ncbi:MAG: hypothetical protein PUI16_07380 [Clostridia bacterium]|nr:hypothetical protein [Clostridia bacterium]MDY5555597.1 hypothetical protein [Blautia sp.]
MQIEIPEAGRMMQTGSSLLRIIQNNNTPILDLLVRESIQNSLDAATGIKKYVEVDFNTGTFDKNEFCKNLDVVGPALIKKYPEDTYEYISVRDYYTEGLTGPLHYNDVINNDYGNLLKLVYDISKAQQQEGAGGSWGLGKTVYFRVGIGLVVYYSRILDHDNNYQSRLAVSLVEDENSNDTIIPPYGNINRGIAWWGQKIGDNQTCPVTDENEVNEILRIFDFTPYSGDQTGTAVIIPFINKEELLNNNSIEYLDGAENKIKPFWQSSLSDYLSVSVQRWYAPRLVNPEYRYGKYLRVRINDTNISFDSMEPEFQIIQSLYNRANNVTGNNDVLQEEYEDNTFCSDIRLRGVMKTPEAGNVAYTMVDRNILKMNYPDNKPSPYMYFNCEIKGTDYNKPVVCFTRKPGMIVNYENIGKWADGLPESDSDHFIFVVFSLNSENSLIDDSKMPLEEYIRKSEKADHTKWDDYNIGDFNPRIITKIQSQISKKVSADFGTEDEQPSERQVSGLGKFLGDLLLPPEGYGTKPTKEKGTNPGNGITVKHKDISLRIFTDKTKYGVSHMVLSMRIKSSKNIGDFSLNIGVDSENGTISSDVWENQLGLKMPFEISTAELKFKDTNGSEHETVLDENTLTDTSLPVIPELDKSGNGIIDKILFKPQKPQKINAEVLITIKLIKRDLQPVFYIADEEK